ncbi:putative lipoprotein [Cystobacter fuscus DSM 2262]|uniref:Lipoprotein n=1 Tax=Cystobacter fuscus (strain ATCC 25194 / DSM 2262 / NBRC 100088 / M29) TaxID=1242864 RepID=S9PJI4_CYSF2|nr:DUF6748 domain-containing protein [Cystobacter fuscus]EPX64450.1 putative lipoprotein [Cystobacter fuscus DSM 2262]
MTSRSSLLALPLALGLLAGCTSNTRPPVEDRPAESGGTPAATGAEVPPPPAPASPPTAPSEDVSGGTAAASDSKPVIYIVKDSGVRCMAAPCPSLVARPADDPKAEGLRITDLDLSALGLTDEQQGRLMEKVHQGAGLKVEASVSNVPHAGPAGAATVLRVNRVVEGK